MTQIEKVTNELKNRNINQKDFCASLNIRPNTFSAWKMRNSDIPTKYVVPICNYFGWPVWQFLNCNEENQNCEFDEINVQTLEVPLSAAEDEAYRLFKSLPESSKIEIMQTIMKRAREYISGTRNEQ